jgi:hypothetical protein
MKAYRIYLVRADTLAQFHQQMPLFGEGVELVETLEFERADEWKGSAIEACEELRRDAANEDRGV